MNSPVSQTPVGAWLDALAGDDPAPGGGAAAALCGALGAALVSMVSRFTIDRPKYAAVQEEMRDALAQCEGLRVRLLDLVDADAEAYHAVAAAYRLPKDGEREARQSAIQAALVQATEVPLQIAEAARAVIVLAELAARSGNRSVGTDAGGAALLGQAAMRAALLNVDVNLAALRDEARREQFAARRQAVVDGVDELVAATLAVVATRQG